VRPGSPPVANDIGGHAVRGGGTLRRGLLFRISGGLAGAAELAGLDDLGLRALVDLRGPDEDRSAFEAYCRSRDIIYRHRPIPLAGAAEVSQVLRHHANSVEDARRFLAAVLGDQFLADGDGEVEGDWSAVSAGVFDLFPAAPPAGKRPFPATTRRPASRRPWPAGSGRRPWFPLQLRARVTAVVNST
jgi:hypothetical protein